MIKVNLRLCLLWVMLMQSYKLLADRRDFDFSQALLQLLPKELRLELQKIIIKNKGKSVENLGRLTIDAIEAKSFSLNEDAGSMLNHLLFKPQVALDFFSQAPFAAFSYFFQGLTAVNIYETQQWNLLIESTIQKEHEQALKQLKTKLYRQKCLEIVSTVLGSMATALIAKVLLEKAIDKISKYLPSRSGQNNEYSSSMGLDYHEVFPGIIRSIIATSRAYESNEKMGLKLAEMLQIAPAQVEETCIFKLHCFNLRFIKEFTAATDKTGLLANFFKELKQLRDLADQLTTPYFKQKIQQAKAEIEAELKQQHPELENSLAAVLLGIVTKVTKKLFPDKS